MEVLPADQWVVKDQAQAWEVPSLCRPGAISVSMWGFLQPQGTPSYHSRQMGLVVPHFRYIYIYIWNLPGGAYTFGQSTCETFRQLQLHQIFLLRHSIAWALPGDRFDRQGVLLHGCGTDVPWLVPIKGAATRWSKTQNQNDENWVADGGSNGRPYFFKLHLRLDDSSSSWRAMLSAELSNVGVLPMVTIAHFMQLQSVQGGDRLGNRWLCRMKTWCQMCVSSGNQT